MPTVSRAHLFPLPGCNPRGNRRADQQRATITSSARYYASWILFTNFTRLLINRSGLLQVVPALWSKTVSWRLGLCPSSASPCPQSLPSSTSPPTHTTNQVSRKADEAFVFVCLSSLSFFFLGYHLTCTVIHRYHHLLFNSKTGGVEKNNLCLLLYRAKENGQALGRPWRREIKTHLI